MLKKLFAWVITIATLFTSIQYNQYEVKAVLLPTHIILNGSGIRPFMVRDTSTWEITDYETLQDAVDHASAGGSSIIQFGDGDDGEDPIVTMTNAVPLIAKNNAVFTGNLELGSFTNGIDGAFTISDGVRAVFEDLYFENTTAARNTSGTIYVQGSVSVKKGGTLVIQGNTEIIHTNSSNSSSAIYNSGNVKMESGLISVNGNGISNLTPDATVDQTAGIEITGGSIISSNGYPIYVNNSNVYTLISIKNAVIEQTDSLNGNPAIYSTETAIPTITIYESAQIYSKRLGNLPGVIVMAVPNRTNASVLSGNGTYGSIIYKNESDASQLTIHHTYHARTLLSGATRDKTSDSYLTGPITGLNGIKNATLKVDRIINCEGQTTYSEQFKNWSNTANTYQNAVTNPQKIDTILSSLPDGSNNIYPNFYCPAKSTSITFTAKNGATAIPLAEDTSSTTATAIKLTATVPNTTTTFDLSFLKDWNGTTVKDSKGSTKSSPINALPLNVGINTFTYTATSQDGTQTKTYTIEITREAAPIKPAAPGVSADDVNNVITGLDLDTMEYSLDGGKTWTQAASPDLSGNKLVEVRVKAEGINPASDSVPLTFTTNPIKPAAPGVSADDVNNVITGLDLDTMEYSLDGGKTWTQAASPDLSGNKLVEVRVKAEGINPASDSVPLTFTTNPEIKKIIVDEDNLGATLDGIENIGLTPEELANTLSIKLVLTPKLASQLTSEEKTLIDNFISQNIKGTPKALLLDVSLFKVMDGEEYAINSTLGKITISFVVPEAYRGEDFMFVRSHDGVIEKLDYVYDASTFTLIFQTDRFSTYGILAGSANAEPLPNTGVDGTTAGLLLLMGLILLGISKPTSNKNRHQS